MKVSAIFYLNNTYLNCRRGSFLNYLETFTENAMSDFTCTNWAFNNKENQLSAMFQIKDTFLVRYDGEDGFYIPEGDASGDMQCWTGDDFSGDAFAIQAEFEANNDPDNVAKICGLQSFIEEIELSKNDSDYEFNLSPDLTVSAYC